MYILFFILILIALLVYLIFEEPVRVYGLFDTSQEDMHLTLYWRPALKAKVRLIQMQIHADVYWFRWKIFSKVIKRKKNSDRLFSNLSLRNTDVKLYYGLDQAQNTGLIFGVMNILSTLPPLRSFEQYPEFFPTEEYFRVEIKSQLFIGQTLVQFMKQKIAKSKRSKNYGSIKSQ